MSGKVQIDWLDYWFRPRVEQVGAGNFLARMAELRAAGIHVSAIGYKQGKYTLEYGATAKRMGTETTVET